MSPQRAPAAKRPAQPPARPATGTRTYSHSWDDDDASSGSATDAAPPRGQFVAAPPEPAKTPRPSRETTPSAKSGAKARAEPTPRGKPTARANPTAEAKAAAKAADALDDEKEFEPIAFPLKHQATYFPAITARTSLFCASRVERDPDPDNMANPVKVDLRCQSGYRLTAWGPRLNMHDKIVWETAVQIAFEQRHGFGSRFVITLRDFARRMNWKNTSAKSLRWIWHSLRRLYFIRLEFEMPNGTKGGGSMLSTAIQDGEGNFVLRLNPDFCAPVFFNDNSFLVKAKRRGALGSQLSKWLHDFLSTHKGYEGAAPDGSGLSLRPERELLLEVKYLRELSGFQSGEKQFVEDLRAAMNELKKGAHELVSDFELLRIGKSSDTWQLRIVRGSESPTYIVPELTRTEREWKTDPPAAKSKGPRRRGGVAL